MNYTTVDSPIGELTLVGDEHGLAGLYMEVQRHGPKRDPAWRRDPAALADAAEQLEQYFAGERTEFELELAPRGTEFQQRVWSLLLEIPFGANGRNPISIVVPCHRVIGANGKLVGYGGGLDRKRALLAHEAEVKSGFKATLW
jgi:methylated-DNA-[protein]-cysteine S-methyltransferase